LKGERRGEYFFFYGGKTGTIEEDDTEFRAIENPLMCPGRTESEGHFTGRDRELVPGKRRNRSVRGPKGVDMGS